MQGSRSRRVVKLAPGRPAGDAPTGRHWCSVRPLRPAGSGRPSHGQATRLGKHRCGRNRWHVAALAVRDPGLDLRASLSIAFCRGRFVQRLQQLIDQAFTLGRWQCLATLDEVGDSTGRGVSLAWRGPV